MNRVRVTYIPGLPGSPKIAPGLISSASRRTNPGGTAGLYWPDADTERITAPTAQPAHLIPFETLIRLSLISIEAPRSVSKRLELFPTASRCCRRHAPT